MSNSQGKFVWYELMTSDTKAAEAFYSAILGWSAQDAGTPDMSYTLFSAGSIQVAGLMAVPEEARKAGAQPGWTGYVAVEDVDASAARIAEAGGRVHHGPADIPGVGRFAVVADPQGAALVVFHSTSEAPASVPNDKPGYAGWRELHAADREAAFAFYSAQFGWSKAEAVDMGPMGIYQLVAAGGETFGGMMTKPETEPKPFWLYYFNVEAIDAAVLRVKAAGGQVVNGPQQVPGGTFIVHGLDPQGVLFALSGPRV